MLRARLDLEISSKIVGVSDTLTGTLAMMFK